jgi:hypothetical protein
MVRTFALVVGVVFLLLGILGFFMNPLLGIFAVNWAHNLIHLLVGVLGIAAWYYADYARLYCQVLGVFFLVIGIVGFVPGVTTADGMMLGLVQVDYAGNVLHLAVGAVAALFGFAPQFSGRISPAR